MPGLQPITITNNDTSLGSVKVNDNLKIQEATWTGEYFETVPIELTAVAEIGYEFLHWSGDIESTEATISISLLSSNNVVPNFIETTIEAIVINYKSSDDFDANDWVELYNPNDMSIDISNWQLKDNNDINIFSILTGTLIGSLIPTVTGRTQFWATSETQLTVSSGVYDLFLVFVNPQMNINWFDIVIPDPAVIAHADPNFAGTNYEFSEGEYSFTNNIYSDDVISSLQIKEGYQVEVFENDDFTDNSEIFEAGDINCLVDINFDNTISSIIVREQTLSINDNQELANSMIFPNPILDVFTITGAKDSTIRIYDINGKTLLTKLILNDSDKIDVSNLLSDFYFAEVLNSNTKSVIKLIKK